MLAQTALGASKMASATTSFTKLFVILLGHVAICVQSVRVVRMQHVLCCVLELNTVETTANWRCAALLWCVSSLISIERLIKCVPVGVFTGKLPRIF